MFNKLKMVLNNGTIMKRIGFTLIVLFIYKLLTFIPIPLVDTQGMKDFIASDTEGFLSILNTFSGNALSNFSILALGISPYITSSIVIQLLQMDIIPIFKEWGEQGEVGKQKLNKVTRYVAIALGVVQALVLLLGLSTSKDGIIINESIGQVPVWLAYVYMTVALSAGCALILWLSDLITRKGVGNGTSMIIVAGIVTSLPSAATQLWGTYININGTWSTDWTSYVKFGLIVLFYFAVILGTIYVELANRKIPVQYANRQGKTDSNIPMKLNSSGVIPVIFASTLMSIPLTIISVLGLNTTTGAGKWLKLCFSYSEPIGFIVYILLIYLFTFFYAFLTINPEKIADNLQKQNAYIPGVKPGEETESFIARVLFKITIIGGTLLTILAIIPIITSWIFTLPGAVTIGGTSLLIIVGVAIETTKQVETEATEKSYSGFIK